MPIKRVQFPDGTIKRIEVPEGATDDDVLAFAYSQRDATQRTATAAGSTRRQVTPPAPATQEVELPYGTTVEFPAGMPRDQMEHALQQHHAQAQPWLDDPVAGDMSGGRPQQLSRIERALRAADAAGNSDDARRLAEAYVQTRDAPASNPWDGDEIVQEGQARDLDGLTSSKPSAFGGTAAAPSEEELFAALERADAAGDSHAARTLANEIQRLRETGTAQPPGKRSRFGGMPVNDEQERQHPRNSAANFPDATLQMATPFGTFDTRVPIPQGAARTLAGVGEAFSTAIPGLKQAASESANSHLMGVDAALRSMGANNAAGWVNQHLGAPVYRDVMQRRNAEAERREQDAALNETWGGKIGLIGGTAVQMLGPGGVAKLGTKVPQLARIAPALQATSAALLPKTVRGNTGLGALAGYMQSSTDGADRAVNAGMGGLGGFVGAGIPRAAGATARGTRTVFDFLGGAGPQRQAVNLIRSEASNPSALMSPNPSAIPGVHRSLFEESLDPGVARLETYSRGAKGTGWVERDAANNAARVQAVQRFAGDEAQLAQAVEARTAATDPLYATARKAKGIETTRLVSQIDRLIEMEAGRPAVQSGLRTVRGLLNSPEGLAGNVLSNVRLTIGDMLGGKYGGGSGAALQGSRALIAVRDQLDRLMTKAVPEYGQANATYRSMSAPINRMQTGQLLMKRATASMEDPITSLPLFSASKLGQQIKSLDTTARSATGFRRTKASDVLGPEDMATLHAVNDDVARSAQRLKYGSGGNSHTASQGALARRLATQGLARFIPGAQAAMEFLEAAGASRVQGALTEVLQNPAQYRAIAARLPARDRGLLEQAMVRIGGAGGRSLALPNY